MKRGIRKRAHENLSDANIRRVVHALKEEGITKKSACEMLNISYNTTRLNRIIEEFEDQENYVSTRKAQNRGKPASKQEIKEVIQDYIEGDNVSDIAKSIYRSQAFVKGIIDRVGVPQRPTGKDKYKEAMLPDACLKDSFEKGEVAWSAKHHMSCIVEQEYTVEFQNSMPGIRTVDYEKEYGCRMYRVWCYNLIPYSDEYEHFGWWPGRKKIGFSAHALAHSLGSLKHLEEYGVSFEG
jgi:hypothetical protein